jgi:hypothetical protein
MPSLDAYAFDASVVIGSSTRTNPSNDTGYLDTLIMPADGGCDHLLQLTAYRLACCSCGIPELAASLRGTTPLEDICDPLPRFASPVDTHRALDRRCLMVLWVMPTA